MIVNKAVRAIAGNGVPDPGIYERKRVYNRFGENDFLVEYCGLPVKNATPRTGKIKVIGTIAVMHLRYPPAIDAGRIPRKIVQRKRHAPIEMLMPFVVQDAHFFQLGNDFPFIRKDIKEGSVREADFKGGEQGIVRDPPAYEIISGLQVLSKSGMVEVDDTSK